MYCEKLLSSQQLSLTSSVFIVASGGHTEPDQWGHPGRHVLGQEISAQTNSTAWFQHRLHVLQERLASLWHQTLRGSGEWRPARTQRQVFMAVLSLLPLYLSNYLPNCFFVYLIVSLASSSPGWGTRYLGGFVVTYTTCVSGLCVPPVHSGVTNCMQTWSAVRVTFFKRD